MLLYTLVDDALLLRFHTVSQQAHGMQARRKLDVSSTQARRKLDVNSTKETFLDCRQVLLILLSHEIQQVMRIDIRTAPQKQTRHRSTIRGKSYRPALTEDFRPRLPYKSCRSGNETTRTSNTCVDVKTCKSLPISGRSSEV